MSNDDLFRLPKHIETRWASMENPDGARGAGGSSNHGRKGSPATSLAAGAELVLTHAEGSSGMVRRIWITINERTPEMLRGLVLRAWWDGADKPAIEDPLGDFFGLALGRVTPFVNAWFDNPEGRSFNCRIPMPFRTGFRITVTNEAPVNLGSFFYDVNYTLGDKLDSDAGYLHAYFSRQAPTTYRKDFEILPHVNGRGRFLGCTLGVIADTEQYGAAWWGEGEVKAYLDGDDELPTLCGTGTEDYIATGWGQGAFSTPWHGCPIADHEQLRYSFYRLHGPDPIYFQRSARVTIQQMGGWQVSHSLAHMRAHLIPAYLAHGDGNTWITQEDLAKRDQKSFFLFERQDDVCATAYFYLDHPSSELPAIQGYEERVANLTA